MQIMKLLRAWAIAICLFAGCVSPPIAPWTVVRVTDGDTFIVLHDDGRRERVRFHRINAPELDEPGGPEARDALKARLLGKRINLTVYARDKWGRMIAEIDRP